MASSARPRGGGAASAQRILAIMENKRHEVGFAFLDLQRPVLELKQWLELQRMQRLCRQQELQRLFAGEQTEW